MKSGKRRLLPFFVGLQRERQYREHFGGVNKILVITLPDGTMFRRQVDIFIEEENYVGELKTGYATWAKNRSEAVRDAILVELGFDVEWILEQDGDMKLKQALEAAGIKVHIGPKIP